MGYFVKGEYIYVLAKIIEVNAEDSTKYRVKTDLANFYVTEAKDTLRSNPADVYTASEMYGLAQNIARMSVKDLHICFGDDVNNATEVLLHGWSMNELRQMYLEWEFGNKVTVGDIVYYTPATTQAGSDPIICSVISIIEKNNGVGNTSVFNTYLLYDDITNKLYTAERAEIVSAHKRSNAVIAALDDLDKATKKAREDIE